MMMLDCDDDRSRPNLAYSLHARSPLDKILFDIGYRFDLHHDLAYDFRSLDPYIEWPPHNI